MVLNILYDFHFIPKFNVAARQSMLSDWQKFQKSSEKPHVCLLRNRMCDGSSEKTHIIYDRSIRKSLCFCLFIQFRKSRESVNIKPFEEMYLNLFLSETN